MRTYRYKVQTSRYGLFLGVTAEAVQLNAPPINGNQVSDRVWMDTSRVQNFYSGKKLELNGREIAWLNRPVFSGDSISCKDSSHGTSLLLPA
ncbi:hypothetical protein [Kitasatospora sp. NPDC050463]|uniref:hypothetical protein n=1 Tax=Kitasatospora sp. NPDC050463 TaxID=3155786 RepID=UPI0033F0F419